MEPDSGPMRHGHSAALRALPAEQVLEFAPAALIADPRDIDARVALVNALADLDRAGEAISVAKTGVELEPMSSALHAAHAMALRVAGKTAKSLEASSQAVRLSPNDVNVLMCRDQCSAQHASGRVSLTRTSSPHLRDAVLHADRACELAPHVAATHFVRAQVHLVAKQWHDAEERARVGLAIDPTDSMGLEILGMSHAGRRDFRGASEHYVAAGRVDARSQASPLLAALSRQRALLLVFPLVAAARGLVAARASLAAWIVLIAVTSLCVAVGFALSRSWWLSPTARRARRTQRAVGGS